MSLPKRILGIAEQISDQVTQVAEKWLRGFQESGGVHVARGRVSRKIYDRFHRVAHGLLKSQGFTLELKQYGDSKIGMWRKKTDPKSARSTSADAKRLVLIPGLGDASISWMGILGALRPILKKDFDEIVILEFPSFMGALKNERGFNSFDAMVSQVSDVLDYLRPDVLVGHSLGSWLSAHYSLQCGQKARPAQPTLGYTGPTRVILIAPPGLWRGQDTIRKWGDIFWNATELGYEFLRPHVFGKEPKWFKLILPSLEEFFRSKELHEFVRSFGDQHFFSENLVHFHGDLWIVWGEKDTLNPSHELDEWLKHLSKRDRHHVHGIVLKGIGHSPHVENPVVTGAMLAQILRGRSLSERGKRFWELRKPAA